MNQHTERAAQAIEELEPGLAGPASRKLARAALESIDAKELYAMILDRWIGVGHYGTRIGAEDALRIAQAIKTDLTKKPQ